MELNEWMHLYLIQLETNTAKNSVLLTSGYIPNWIMLQYHNINMII